MKLSSHDRSVFDQLPVLADTVRARVLLVLERQPLAVGELCTILQLPQSTMSRHLKLLTDAGWLAVVRDGTSRLYQMDRDGLDAGMRRLWLLVREQLETAADVAQDERRLESVLRRRRTTSERFFSSAAADWDRVREELFGSTIHLRALAALLNPAWVVGDLGCGTGSVSEALAPFVARVVAVDASREMLAAARSRLRGQRNIEFRRGTVERLPIDDASLDAAIVALVLHHVASPETVFAEAARVLKPGGVLVVVDMLPHDREEYRRTMGHVWTGFSDAAMKGYYERSSLTAPRIVALVPPDDAKGPALFVASGTRSATRLTLGGCADDVK